MGAFGGLPSSLWNKQSRLEALPDRFGIERASLGPVAACVKEENLSRLRTGFGICRATFEIYLAACAKKKNHSRLRPSLAVGVQEQLLAFRRTSSVVCVVQALRISCGGMGSAKRVTTVGIIWV